MPTRSAIGRAKQCCIFDPCVNRVGIGEGWFQMPHPLELPRMRLAIVKLVRSEGFAGFWRGVVNELVARALHGLGARFNVASRRLPRLAPVIGALDHLAEPAAALRRINSIGVGGRALEMVELPAREVGTTDIPVLTLAVRCQDKRSFARPH